jgi:hypothetical protein
MDSTAVVPVRAGACGLPSALFVSKMEQRWHGLFKEKFSGHYDLHTVYILGHVREQGYVAFVDWLNAYIRGTGSRLVLLDIEFFFGFGIDLILGITKDVRIVLTTFDDIIFHEMNYINALGCDLVTCGDPLAVLKYREKGAHAELLFLENSRRPFDEFQGIVKDIDVLFFGNLTKSGRKEFIEELIANGIEVTVHSSSVNTELSYPELAHLISRSKVVLNLSKTQMVMGRPEAFVPVWSFLQFKGRVIEAGLGGAACVSEYAPSIEYLFGNETVLMFRTVDECTEIIRGLLDNPVRLVDLSARLRGVVLERFEQASQVQRLVDVIENSPPVAKVAPKWIPYRYIVAMAMARFVTVRRPLRVWMRDLLAFVLGAWVYPMHLRLLVVLKVILGIFKRHSGR